MIYKLQIRKSSNDLAKSFTANVIFFLIRRLFPV